MSIFTTLIGPWFIIIFSAMAMALPSPTLSSRMSLSLKSSQFFGSSGLARL